MVQHAHARRDVERAVLIGQRGRIADEELAVGRRERVPRGDEVGGEIDADDAADERRERERKRPRPAPAVERALGAGKGGEQVLHTVTQRRSAFLLDRHAIPDHVTHR